MEKNNGVISRICEILEKYLKNNNKGRNIVVEMSGTCIRLSLDVAVCFIIANEKNNNISLIDLCAKNCLVKQYYTLEECKIINSEIKKFIGEEFYTHRKH